MKLSMILSAVLLSLNAFAGGGGTGDKVCPGGHVVGPWVPCPGQASQAYRCEFASGAISLVKVGVTTYAGHPEADFVVGQLYSEKLFKGFQWSKSSALGEILSPTIVSLKSTSISKLNLKIDVKTGHLRGTARGVSIDQKGVCVEQHAVSAR